MIVFRGSVAATLAPFGAFILIAIFCLCLGGFFRSLVGLNVSQRGFAVNSFNESVG